MGDKQDIIRYTRFYLESALFCRISLYELIVKIVKNI